jgi:hypothetical protein
MKADCDVTVYGHFTVNNASAWTNALTSISNASDGSSAGSPNVFIINITGSFSVPGTYNNSINGNCKEVRLTGSGTLSLSSGSNGSLIWTAANQTFIIDGPTLQGKSGNYTSLVTIVGNSAVELRNGYIKGNTTGNGGGVYVYEGNFTMTGGEISGNTADNYGGGVAVYGGTFTMNGGNISGNAANNYMSSNGGGVYVSNDSNFTMTGGVIYGTDADPESLKNTAITGAAAYIENTQPPEIINTTIYSYP